MMILLSSSSSYPSSSSPGSYGLEWGVRVKGHPESLLRPKTVATQSIPKGTHMQPEDGMSKEESEEEAMRQGATVCSKAIPRL